MNFYSKLPDDLLIAFYTEIMKKIENEILTKSLYDELGLIFDVAHQRRITLKKPDYCNQIMSEEELLNV
ncbi:hypothetical protein R4Z10_05930 [Niallia sp. XMNu-256]|uniref:hypothetical protein n=1 Tax=Niallia sp. XMNu-256 TaxID=3082444 RepID=UPI0030CC4E7B